VREEIAALPAPSTLSALRAHTGLARVIKESMRLYPESWAIGREALERLEVGAWLVEPQTQVYLYQWAAHMNPVWFERPEEFLPARWTPQFEAALPRAAYTPFGGGPRICIGNHFAWAELVVVLAAALERYELQPLAPFRPRLLASITARPRDPVPMRVVRIRGAAPSREAGQPTREAPPAA